MPKLGDFFPEKHNKEIKPYWRGFYCDYQSCDLNTGQRKQKFQIYCDFIENYIEDFYMFIVTTSKNYKETYSNYYSFSRDSHLNVLDDNYKKYLDENWYIYPRQSSLSFSECKKKKFSKHIKSWRFLHIWYINTIKYRELKDFLKNDVIQKNLNNKINELKGIEFEDSEKNSNAQKYLNSI